MHTSAAVAVVHVAAAVPGDASAAATPGDVSAAAGTTNRGSHGSHGGHLSPNHILSHRLSGDLGPSGEVGTNAGGLVLAAGALEGEARVGLGAPLPGARVAKPAHVVAGQSLKLGVRKPAGLAAVARVQRRRCAVGIQLEDHKVAVANARDPVGQLLASRHVERKRSCRETSKRVVPLVTILLYEYHRQFIFQFFLNKKFNISILFFIHFLILLNFVNFIYTTKMY